MSNRITNIQKLKNIGSFKNYTASPDIELSDVNLFYGYNGSGKTTLSRVFRALNDGETFILNNDGSKIVDFENSDINIHCNNVWIKSFSESNIKGKIKVFNEDFVERNLALKAYKAKKLTAIIGESNIALKKEIETLEQTKESLLNPQKGLKAEEELVGAQNAFETLKTEVAGLIRAALQNKTPYDKRHLAQDYINYKEHGGVAVITDEQAAAAASMFSAETKPAIEQRYMDALKHIENILKPEFYCKTFKLLEAPIKRKSIQIPEEVITWIETGAKLHKEKHDICQFCGQSMSAETWGARVVQIQELIKKDDDFEKIEREFNDTKSEVLSYAEAIKRFSCDLTEAHFFIPEAFSDYTVARSTFDTAFDKFLTELDNIVKLVEQKDRCKDEVIIFPDTEKFNEILNTLKLAIPNVIAAIKKNNQAIQDSDVLKEENKKTVSTYYIQQSEERLKNAETNIEEKAAEHKKAVDLFNNTDTRIKACNDTLGNQSEIITKINALLDKTLDIGLKFRFEPTSGEYLLERKVDGENNRPAKNLSEGERNLIAFLYFLVSLESSSAKDKNTEIIVIDDPVSSLDSNNLFVLQTLVMQTLVQYGQAFFLTHNFYFFAKIREAMRAHLKARQKDKNDPLPLKIYEIKRNKSEGSHIKEASNYTKNHISEYMTLMDSLYKIWQKDDDEKDVTIGNMIRRVLEVFLSFKDTDKTHPLFEKMKKLAGDDTHYQSLLNMAHAFSHTLEITSITDDATFSYAAGKEEIEELFNFMNDKDPDHFKGFGIKLNVLPAVRKEQTTVQNIDANGLIDIKV